MKYEIMIDLETLAVPEDLPAGMLVEVVEIGAVKFGPDGIEDDIHLFPREGNGLCSAGTVSWWMKQPHVPKWLDVRMDAECPEALPSMAECLKKLAAFIGGYNSVVWSKGGFDLKILGDHFSANQLARPWQYYSCRDLRTLMKDCGVAQPYETVAHDALEDAKAQVELLRTCRRVIAPGLAEMAS